ncbi:adenylyl-sulfate kinase [Geomonas sp. RF6]|uniref:adenylyl-sulfate kinase n=1 Tax=Geomonas sp. RF6 TaxID=2897342 RepID=UPI001E2A012D|nr:adenylyl-sulfate kinase [Geomonas sp. RF6]UFS72438.1 adenylyl-sulfate kinase [Geomonas sp. RF6]
MQSGTLYWITGLSGAGKTTIGKALYQELKTTRQHVVFLDGDVLRTVFGDLHGHTVEDRKKLAHSYANLCKMLTEQGIDVVCSTISLFREVHEFNRANIGKYLEIFVDCDFDELVRRDQKGIYSRALRGELKDIIGIDLPYDRPANCDLVIDNTLRDNLARKIEAILNLKERQP